MAKLTVYVRDELLDRARALNPDVNTSQLVQRGLERLSPAEDAAYARRPEDAEKLLAAAAAQLREGAAREYEKGYRTALMTVAENGEKAWPTLWTLANFGFDLKRWAQGWRSEGLSGPPTPSGFGSFVKDLGDMLNLGDAAEYSFIRSEPFIRGYRAALRDAWETAERPEASDASGGDTDTVDGEEVAAPAE